MHTVKFILKNYSFQQVLNLQDKRQILAAGKKPQENKPPNDTPEVPPKRAKVQDGRDSAASFPSSSALLASEPRHFESSSNSTMLEKPQNCY